MLLVVFWYEKWGLRIKFWLELILKDLLAFLKNLQH